MIRKIVSILKIDDFYNESEVIDIAKGKYELQTSFTKAWKNRKRWEK